MKFLLKSTVLAVVVSLATSTINAQDNNQLGRTKQSANFDKQQANVAPSPELKSKTIEPKLDKVTKLKQEYINANTKRRLEIDKEIKSLNAVTVKAKNTTNRQAPKELKDLNSQLDEKRFQLKKSSEALQKAKLKLKSQKEAGKLSASEIKLREDKIKSVENRLSTLKASIAKAEQALNTNL